MIVPEVFGFVNGKCPERVRSEAEALGRGFGVQGKGAASPFIPCFLDVEEKQRFIPSSRPAVDCVSCA